MLANVKTAIRSRFTSMKSLNLADLAQIEYLNRVIREGLRDFPPAPDIFPRIVPRGGDFIMGKFLPEGVSSLVFIVTSLPAAPQ